MITLTREEAQHLLEVFELFLEEAEDVTTLENNLVKMLRTRLAQPEPKDDGHCQACNGDHCTAKTGCVALSNPPQREWQGLTDKDRQELAAEQHGWEGLCSAVEAKLKEKNNG